MKAIRLHAHGGPENIFLDEISEPGAPARGELKVAVRAMALNRLDVAVRNGIPGITPALPLVMGCDASGVVLETGEAVTGFNPGDRVVLTPMLFCGACEACASGEQSMCTTFRMLGEHMDGHFAEIVNLPAQAVRRIASTVSYETAAAYCLTFLTAWRMIVTRAKLRPGERLLIHGIGGGVSNAALAISNLIGAVAIVTSGDDSKIAKAIELGAATGFNYKTQDVAKEVFRFTQKEGVEVVADSVGGPAWAISIKTARPGGRIVTCGATAGFNPPADLGRVFWKQLDIMGSTMGNMKEFTDVIAMLNTGKLKPLIDKVFKAEQVREAHERLNASAQFGKVVMAF